MSTVSSAFLRSYLESCVDLGAPEPELMALVPGGRAALTHPDGRFAGEAVIRILDLAAEMTGFDMIGLEAGRRFRAGSFLDVGFTLAAAGTIREALDINSRFQPLTQEMVRTRFEIRGGEACIIYTPAQGTAARMRRVMEAVFASYARIGNQLLRDDRPLIGRIQFRHNDPGGRTREAYRAMFGDQIRFGAAEDMLVFREAVAGLPLPGANPQILEMMTPKLEARLEQLRNGRSLPEEVRNCVHSELGQGRPSLERIAALTGLTTRTLRRRLAVAGTGFGQILQDARREAAEIYIRDASMTLSQMAFALGYGEQAAFVRAFRSWFGMAPGAYRRQVRGA